MKRFFLLFPVVLLITINVSAQKALTGRVFDSETGDALPFVNVIYNSHKEGCISDLDGYFSIPDRSRASFLRCSFVGYAEVLKDIPPDADFVRVEMTPETLTLSEVTVLPGENPAHRIVYNVINNKDAHNPEKLESYQFVSYSKMYFTINADSISVGLERDSLGQITDTSGRARMADFLENHHLFMMESVTEKQFESPDKASEKILATRVSGLKHPKFTYLASQYQSFSFYGEMIGLGGSEYISPLSKNSPKKYFFLLKDTAYSASGDTTFIMTFRPKNGTNFKGLKGVVYISSDGWAIQNVIAEPVEQAEMKMKIQQQYNKPDGVHWFPYQLNTDFVFNMVEMVAEDSAGAGQNFGLLGVGKTYIRDVVIDEPVDRKLRGGNEVKYVEDATKRDSVYWNRYRIQTLDKREINTYNLVDSIGDEYNLDEVLASVEIFMTGKVPYKFLSFDLNRLFWFNEPEGTRLSLGLETNNRLSRFFSLNAYGAYGIRDNEFKYGGGVRLFPFGNDRLSLNAGWSHDLRESDAYDFNEARLFSTESFRQFFISNLDWYDTWSASVDARIFRGFHMNAYLDFNDVLFTDNFRYANSFTAGKTGWESGLKLKWIIREDVVRTPSGNVISMGSKYPEINLNVRKGFPWQDQSYKDYWRFEARFHDVIETKWAGDFHLTLDAGYLLSDNAVYGQNFLLHSSGKWLDSDYSFATMRPGEFVSDRFVSAFFKYDIGSLLFHVKNWAPEFALVTNAVIGDYSYNGVFYSLSGMQLPAIAPRKGYVESGLQINALMKQFFIKYGVGFYYHYGPYSGNAFKDNYAVKLRLVYEM